MNSQTPQNGMTRIVVTTLGSDRSGIVAAVSGELARHGANILEISQSILDGIFTMSMIVELDEKTTSFDTLAKALDEVQEQIQVQIKAQREDVFKFMYRV